MTGSCSSQMFNSLWKDNSIKFNYSFNANFMNSRDQLSGRKLRSDAVFPVNCDLPPIKILSRVSDFYSKAGRGKESPMPTMLKVDARSRGHKRTPANPKFRNFPYFTVQSHHKPPERSSGEAEWAEQIFVNSQRSLFVAPPKTNSARHRSE